MFLLGGWLAASPILYAYLVKTLAVLEYPFYYSIFYYFWLNTRTESRLQSLLSLILLQYRTSVIVIKQIHKFNNSHAEYFYVLLFSY